MSGTAVAATLPVVRALLDEAIRKNYRSGVLGVRTRPEWTGSTTFVHDDIPVSVVPCVSSLAVREALMDRRRNQWLVVLTDRSDSDLGAGVLSHLVFNRLRTTDPWEAVRHRFAATGIDPALTSASSHRELASGLLAAAPPGGWPPAPGGVLTVDHALGAVAEVHLALADPTVDATTVLTWTADDTAAARLGDLRRLAGDVLVDTLLTWIANRAGAASAPLLHLLRTGASADAVPLGLLAGLLGDAGASNSADAVQLARDSFIRLEPRFGGTQPPAHALGAWASETFAVVGWMLDRADTRTTAERLLSRADVLLTEVQATGLADRSDVLPTGLTRRLAHLAGALRAAVLDDVQPVTPTALAQVEQAWSSVVAHRLAPQDRRTTAFAAAVRLTRWLSRPDVVPDQSMATLVGRHSDVDAWVDSAVNDAARGVGDADLGSALEAVLRPTRARRHRHDLELAAALVTHTADDPAPAADGLHHGVAHLEELLPTTVLPLARATPMLLLVLDGMSVGVGHEVVSDVLARATEGWLEVLLPGRDRRATALAVLPTLTEVSRTSLLCGELRSGSRDTEAKGHRALALAHGLRSAVLFHKKPLDSTRPGYALADDVGAAIDDALGQPLVTCVLNTIDDALDRSDPSGTEWGADAVRHLEPLLARARRAGRAVVLTADHGHIVERRQGTMRAHPAISSGRSREAAGMLGEGEVLVAGRRVVTPTSRVVLAVDEGLRYGPLKAGYHGGAAPAEVVVPVIVLVNGAVPADTGLRLAPPQEPLWWDAPLSSTPVMLSPAVSQLARKAAEEPPTLFDAVATEAPVSSADSLATAVLRSATYRQQRAGAGRVAVADDQVLALLNALLAGPANRLAAPQASIALGVSAVALRGAVPHVQRLLNVEGYGVLTVDADGSTLVLDRDLLQDQFEVTQ